MTGRTGDPAPLGVEGHCQEIAFEVGERQESGFDVPRVGSLNAEPGDPSELTREDIQRALEEAFARPEGGWRAVAVSLGTVISIVTRSRPYRARPVRRSRSKTSSTVSWSGSPRKYGDSKNASTAAAKMTGLKAGTVVVAGGGDGQCAGTGVNVFVNNRAYINLGTAVVSGSFGKSYAWNRAFRTLNAVAEDGYIFESCVRSGTLLINWMVDFHAARGYSEVYPPAMIKEENLWAGGWLPKFGENMYHDAEEDFWWIPTAEVALTNIHRDDILDPGTLPLDYVAYTPCFRREKMSAGRDVRGIKRGHQFDKVEMYRFVEPEALGAGADGDGGGFAEQIQAVLPGVGGHAADRPLLKEVAVVVERRNRRHMNAGQGQGAALVEGAERGRHQFAGRREDDRAVELLRRGLRCLADPQGAELPGKAAVVFA